MAEKKTSNKKTATTSKNKQLELSEQQKIKRHIKELKKEQGTMRPVFLAES